MSKLRKFIKNPWLFFKDATKKRVAIKTAGAINTYSFGLPPQRQQYALMFPDRKFIFIQANISEKKFAAKFKRRILNDPLSEVFIWGYDLPVHIMHFIAENNLKCTYIDNGFIGPLEYSDTNLSPISLVVDRQAPYFDATRPSDLECMLNGYGFAADAGLLERADRLMSILLEEGIGNYYRVSRIEDIQTIYGPKKGRRILVLGEPEDVAGLKYGSERVYTQNDVVTIAATENPGAQIIYKPHPEEMEKPQKQTLTSADGQHPCLVLKGDIPIAQALETIDHVYTVTSLEGFEALMRGINVTTLGCPFYSGWGLTDDRQPNDRRQRRLTLREVFAAAYVLYPKYYDAEFRETTPEIFLKEVLKKLGAARGAGKEPSKGDNLRRKEAKEPKINTEHDDSPVISVNYDTGIPTVMIGAPKWKELLRPWFPDRQLNFVSRRLLPEGFVARFKTCTEILVWGGPPKQQLRRFIEQNQLNCTYVDEGFICSTAAGKHSEPPLSITLDKRTSYKDATRPSDLECLLKEYDFAGNEALFERADSLMSIMLESGLSKHHHADSVADIEAIYGPKEKRRVLVLGQVEKSVSIKHGSRSPYTNNDLAMLAIAENPDAQIIFKPHPEVISKQKSIDSDLSEMTNVLILEQDIPLAQALETIDHVYTITSLGGFEAVIRGIKTTVLGCPFYAGWGLTDDRQPNSRRRRQLTVREVFAAAYLLYPIYFDLNLNLKITPEFAIGRLASTPSLPTHPHRAYEVQSRKRTAFLFGFSPWKSDFIQHVFPEYRLEFIRGKEDIASSREIIEACSDKIFVIWGYNEDSSVLDYARKNNITVRRMGDGFLRSISSGAFHAMPYSLCLEDDTLYFDYRNPTLLEKILSTYDFKNDPALIQEAKECMKLINVHGVGKYNQTESKDINKVYGSKTRKRILVIGHAEDSNSLRYGCDRAITDSDLALLARVENPNAEIYYRPHPDVLNGTRKSTSHPSAVEYIAEVIHEELSLSDALRTIDHVYTITSLAGFEALLRGKKVTTLGCPFYSGWGLTDDRQPNERRTRKLTIEELFAGSYLLYPQYFDPQTREKSNARSAINAIAAKKLQMQLS